eukprot:6666603-Karenia_brevis.AAC.1
MLGLILLPGHKVEEIARNTSAASSEASPDDFAHICMKIFLQNPMVQDCGGHLCDMCTSLTIGGLADS